MTISLLKYLNWTMYLNFRRLAAIYTEDSMIVGGNIWRHEPSRAQISVISDLFPASLTFQTCQRASGGTKESFFCYHISQEMAILQINFQHCYACESYSAK